MSVCISCQPCVPPSPACANDIAVKSLRSCSMRILRHRERLLWKYVMWGLRRYSLRLMLNRGVWQILVSSFLSDPLIDTKCYSCYQRHH